MNIANTRVAVIGMGYVGIPAAVLLANRGYEVTGIQRRSERSGWKIEWLNSGRCPIGGQEPELAEMLKRVVASGKFRATYDFSVIKDQNMILVDVQTPINEQNIPRYHSLKSACLELGKYLQAGQIVIIESTVAPGTTEQMVKPVLENVSGLKAGLPEGFGLCFSYERVMVGRLLHNIREYPKIVGGIDADSLQAATELYRNIVKGGVTGTTILTAEIAKTVENAYRDVQIAFANETALLCEALGVDVYQVRQCVNGLPNDPTVPQANPVRNMHFPGAGVGGHCLPKDTWLLMYGYQQYGRFRNDYPSSLMINARKLNDWMPLHIFELLESALKEAQRDLRESRVCVLGYAFLENSDDARNTPTITLLKELRQHQIAFSIHDPYIVKDEDYCIEPVLFKALKDSDAAVLMTKHDIYRELQPRQLKDLMSTRVIIDGRNLFDPQEFITEGFIYRGIGKGNYNHIQAMKERS